MMRKIIFAVVFLASLASAQVWDMPCPAGSVVQGRTANPLNGHLIAWLCIDTTTGTLSSPSLSITTANIPSGFITLILSGTCPTGWAEVTALNGKMLRGTLAANGDVGQTGGAATITPSGSISQPVFTGTPITSVINHIHAVSITDPGHNHTQNAHTHTLQMQGGTTAATTGVHIMNSTAVGGSSRAATAPDAANSTIATNNTSTTGVTATTAAPVGGVPSITPTGTLSIPTFTGNAIDPSPNYIKVIFCSKQ